MSFLRVKKRVKFNVELTVISLSDVPLISGIIFAKVRLLECGSFEGYTCHSPVHTYKVDFIKTNLNLSFNDNKIIIKSDEINNKIENENNLSEINCNETKENPQPFQFQCRIPFDERTGELEECKLKISLRKECRGGKATQKLGFVILNLSEFAASGSIGIFQSFLLDGYTDCQRQDNSLVNVHIKMIHQAQDPLFKVPKTTNNAIQEDSHLNPADRKAPSANAALNNLAGTTTMGLGPVNNTNNFNDNISKAPVTTSSTKSFGDYFLYYFDDRPISSTNLIKNNNNNTNNIIINQNVNDVLKEQRFSWHAGATSQQIDYSSSSSNNENNEMNLLNTISGTENLLPVRRSSDDQLMLSSSMTSNTGLGGASTSVSNGLSNVNCSSLANRIQKTRRDASNVIDEVFAEMSALLAVETPSTSALSWEGICGSNYDSDNHEEYNNYQTINYNNNNNNNNNKHLQQIYNNSFINNKNIVDKIALTESNNCKINNKLSLLISKDKKNASVTNNNNDMMIYN